MASRSQIASWTPSAGPATHILLFLRPSHVYGHVKSSSGVCRALRCASNSMQSWTLSSTQSSTTGGTEEVRSMSHLGRGCFSGRCGAREQRQRRHQQLWCLTSRVTGRRPTSLSAWPRPLATPEGSAAPGAGTRSASPSLLSCVTSCSKSTGHAFLPMFPCHANTGWPVLQSKLYDEQILRHALPKLRHMIYTIGVATCSAKSRCLCAWLRARQVSATSASPCSTAKAPSERVPPDAASCAGGSGGNREPKRRCSTCARDWWPRSVSVSCRFK